MEIFISVLAAEITVPDLKEPVETHTPEALLTDKAIEDEKRRKQESEGEE